ncbi:hypothetical protein HYPSUDRAFT_41212 [Hypholoma sublateritium FD-334 SS-4]|uniref:Uncharacterized protein n=1 Tax=Hypholoma sublateritium (strain FD-334 SS-4) TaxID=945553 RepID=A0A0D2MEQ5_HYPSF|nr:hypothetical protein HYPSUDRAFT_41212 [Hypholoma sublateritium FD-334 SS-4]
MEESKSRSHIAAPSECGSPLLAHKSKDVTSQPLPHQRISKSRRFTSAAVLLVVSACLLVSVDSVQHRLVNLVKWRGLSYESFLWNICETDTTSTFVVPPNCVEDSDWKTIEAEAYHGPEDASSSSQYVSYTTLNIPVPTKAHSLISFTSKGSHSGGSFAIITSPNQPRDTITFNISRRFKPQAGNFALICLSPVPQMQHGHSISISSPSRPLNRAPIEDEPQFYATTMILPELEEGSEPLQIPHFHTRLDDTVQKMGDIGSKVFFGHISLNTNGPCAIDAVSLTGGSIDIRSNGGSITGLFNSTKVLRLNTSNAPIIVNISLNHSDSPRSFPIASAETSNSPIHASVALFGGDAILGDGRTRSQFTVSAQTTNSPVDVEFKAATVGSALTAVVSTANSSARVVTHPTYEGEFHLSATSGSVEIEDAYADDRSGQGRPRHIEYRETANGVFSGVAYFGDMYPYGRIISGLGIVDRNITISSENSSVILVL